VTPLRIDPIAEARRHWTERWGDEPARPAVPELERLVDRRTKGRARLAPLAILVLVAIALMVYFAAT